MISSIATLDLHAAADGQEPFLVPTPVHISSIEPGDVVVLADGQTLANAVYVRVGDDLVLRTAGGEKYVVEDYIALAEQPNLISADGIRMTPGMDEAFVFGGEHGQVARAGDVRGPSGANQTDESECNWGKSWNRAAFDRGTQVPIV